MDSLVDLAEQRPLTRDVDALGVVLASRALEEDRAEGPWCTRGRIGGLNFVGTASGADDSEAELDFVRSAVDFVGLPAPRFKRDGRCQAEGFQCRDIAAEMVEEKTARCER